MAIKMIDRNTTALMTNWFHFTTILNNQKTRNFFRIGFSLNIFDFSSNKNSVFLALHNWQGNVLHGLELDVGDSVEIVEECTEWYRGSSARKPRIVGIFPKSYIYIRDTTKIDPVVAECTQVLREWSEIWKRLYVVSVSNKISKKMSLPSL